MKLLDLTLFLHVICPMSIVCLALRQATPQIEANFKKYFALLFPTVKALTVVLTNFVDEHVVVSTILKTRFDHSVINVPTPTLTVEGL